MLPDGAFDAVGDSFGFKNEVGPERLGREDGSESAKLDDEERVDGDVVWEDDRVVRGCSGTGAGGGEGRGRGR